MDQHSAVARIRRLERLLAVTLFLASVPWLVLGAAAWKLCSPRIELSSVLVTPGIEVVKADGTTAVSLSAERDSGSLTLHSVEGPAFATLGQQPGMGGALSLVSATGAGIVWLGADRDGGGNLTLRNKANETVIVVNDNDGLGGGFTARRGDDRLIAFFGAGIADAGVLQLNNEDGHAHAYLGRNTNGHGALTLSTRSGVSVTEIGADKASAPFVVMRGVNGRSTVALTGESTGGALSLYDGRETLRAYVGPLDDGTETLELFNRAGEHILVLGECGARPGGVIQAYAPGDRIAFCAGVDDRDGAGRISLHHPSEQRIFRAGMSDDDRGGILNVYDLDGKMTLRVP